MYTPITPLTGLGGYRFLSETRESQEQALERDPEVARETTYFKENIGSVRSSDDLLADRRLLEVALTAYGLESEIDKTALIKRVLDEGVSDERSFANRLNDRRWRDFSAAFGFADPNAGFERSTFQVAVELRYRDDGSASVDRLDPLKLDGFRNGIDKITSIDDLLADPVTLDVALEAFGLERGYYSDAHFRQLLTEGLNSENAYAFSLEPAAWQSFTRAFIGLGDGQPNADVPEYQMIIERELARRDATFVSGSDAAEDPSKLSVDDLRDFRTNIAAVSDPAAALDDPATRKLTLAAFGLSSETFTEAEFDAVVAGALAGDFSAAAAKSNTGWRQFAEAVADAYPGGAPAQTSNASLQIEVAIARADLEAVPSQQSETTLRPRASAEEIAYFQSKATSDLTASALVGDAQLLDIALRAFGLDGENRSTSFIQSILEEDPSDPNAFVNIASNPGWKEFADAFNGSGASVADQWRYDLEDRLTAAGAPQSEIDALRGKWSIVDEALDLVLDPELMDIVLTAFGFEKDQYTTGFVLQMLVSDTSDPNSLPRRLGDERWMDFLSVFGPRTGGNTQLSSFQDETVDRYRDKLFELGVGQSDQSLRIALNFAREVDALAKRPSFETSGWLQIMGDEPLRRVMDAAFGLPTEVAQLDLDTQQELYSNRAAALFGTSSPTALADPLNVVTALERYLLAQEQASQPGVGAPGYGAISMLNQTLSTIQSFNQRA